MAMNAFPFQFQLGYFLSACHHCHLSSSDCPFLPINFCQDKELRYRFIYNHFPSLQEEVIYSHKLSISTRCLPKESICCSTWLVKPKFDENCFRTF